MRVLKRIIGEDLSSKTEMMSKSGKSHWHKHLKSAILSVMAVRDTVDRIMASDSTTYDSFDWQSVLKYRMHTSMAKNRSRMQSQQQNREKLFNGKRVATDTSGKGSEAMGLIVETKPHIVCQVLDFECSYGLEYSGVDYRGRHFHGRNRMLPLSSSHFRHAVARSSIAMATAQILPCCGMLRMPQALHYSLESLLAVRQCHL